MNESTNAWGAANGRRLAARHGVAVLGSHGADRLADDMREEREWCVYPGVPATCSMRGAGGEAIRVSRWCNSRIRHREATARIDADIVLIAITMRPSRATLSIDGGVVHRGALHRGEIMIFAPGSRLQIEWDLPCEVLHLHCPISSLRELDEHDRLPSMCEGMLRSPLVVQRDRMVMALAECLTASSVSNASLSAVLRNAIATAIVSRVLQRLRPHALERGPRVDEQARGQASGPSGKPSGVHGPESTVPALPSWRLDRVFEHVESHLHERVSLVDMAVASGLSRMHFARLFRAATGKTPAEYLLHRRIARARDDLLDTDRAIVDVAASCGFPSQSHFTTVFKRESGMTPHAYRQCRKSQTDSLTQAVMRTADPFSSIPCKEMSL